jgi:hypothetical protein
MNNTETPKPETVQDEPFYVHNVNSNFPERIESYPAVRLSRYEMSPVIWCRVNGIPIGMVA